MKRFPLFCFFISLPVFLFSQNAFVVHGRVEGYPDGTVFTLKSFGSDTLYQGEFVIRGETKREVRSSLYIGESYLESCLVWLVPGAEIFISGDTAVVPRCWEVQSNVPRQGEENRYKEATKDLQEQYADNLLRLEQMYRSIPSQISPDDTVNMNKWSEVKRLQQLRDSLETEICGRELDLMKDLPVTADWLSRLSRYARAVAQEEPYRKYRPLVQACYGRLDETQRNSEDGKSVSFYLTLEIIEEGMMCPDVELFGLDGTRYRLSDFRGKYVLLDFWGRNCGPCKASIPELEKIVRENGKCLTLVSITTDGEKSWRKYSDKHPFLWHNLCDRGGWKGLVARFGFNGVPAFVLLSPEGKVLSKRVGYGKGIIDRWLEKFIGASYTPVEK